MFSIVNSPVPAPMPSALNSYSQITYSRSVITLLKELFNEIGVVDIIHLETLEGLPLPVFYIKRIFPQLKIVHTIHDYGLFCPIVRFWNIHNENCLTGNSKYKCYECLNKKKLVLLFTNT